VRHARCSRRHLRLTTGKLSGPGLPVSEHRNPAIMLFRSRMCRRRARWPLAAVRCWPWRRPHQPSGWVTCIAIPRTAPGWRKIP